MRKVSTLKAPSIPLALAAALASAACPRTEEPKSEPSRQIMVDPAWAEGELPASSRDGTPVSGGTLTVRINTDPPSLDPNLTADLWADRVVVGQVQEALVRVERRLVRGKAVLSTGRPS